MNKDDYNKYLVQINYKNGISMVAWFYKLHFKGSYEGDKSIEWEITEAPKKTKYDTAIKAVFINVDSIDSIWQLDEVAGSLGDKQSKGK